MAFSEEVQFVTVQRSRARMPTAPFSRAALSMIDPPSRTASPSRSFPSATHSAMMDPLPILIPSSVFPVALTFFTMLLEAKPRWIPSSLHPDTVPFMMLMFFRSTMGRVKSVANAHPGAALEV